MIPVHMEYNHIIRMRFVLLYIKISLFIRARLLLHAAFHIIEQKQKDERYIVTACVRLPRGDLKSESFPNKKRN